MNEGQTEAFAKVTDEQPSVVTSHAERTTLRGSSMAETTESSTASDAPKQPRLRRWKLWWAVFLGFAAVIGLVAGILDISQHVPLSHLDIAFTNPNPESGTIPMEACNVQIAGRGTAPAGQTMVVSNQEQGTGANIDPNLYFAMADMGSSGWSADEQLGTSGTAPGTAYTVTVWLVDTNWIDYLTHLTNLPGVNSQQNLWWSSLEPPPGAKMVQAVPVTRSAGKC